MKVLITGGTGLLGKALVETAGMGSRIIATHLGNCEVPDTASTRYEVLDIRDREGYRALFKRFRPDVAIHTAGIGSPDYAERHKDEARAVNVDGTRNIIENCERTGSKFIYVSSNAIYDGARPPYAEDDPPNPINYYGQIKLDGELLAGQSAVESAIVRPILLYGWNHPSGRQNIATFALSKLEKDEEVFVYNDVFVNPVFAPHCADAIWKIIEEERYEMFNIAGKETVSIYRLVKMMAKIFNLNPNLVIPVQQGFFNELVRRPRDTSYDTGKMRDVLGIAPLSVEEGLSLMKRSERRRR